MKKNKSPSHFYVGNIFLSLSATLPRMQNQRQSLAFFNTRHKFLRAIFLKPNALETVEKATRKLFVVNQ
jgi:hypothetical protein